MIYATMRARGATAAFAVFLLLVYTTAAAAEACEVLDKYGEPRECTFTEEFGDCEANARDSWDQCVEWAWEDWDGGWGLDRTWAAAKSTGCDLGYAVDLAACAPTSAIRAAFSL